MPRLREVDFRLLSERGPIEDADLADWPLDYAELEPYYAEAERLVGVAGETGVNPFESWRSGPYPMSPGPDMYGALLSSEAATRLGYHPYRAPTGVNTTDYDDRPACNNCGFCGQYGCPIHAKGDALSSLRRALRTGRCQIRPRATVTAVLLDESYRHARGVQYVDTAGDTHTVAAAHVVLAGGAFETPRLLLRANIGNSSGLLGRHLMFHFQTYVAASFPFSLHPNRGRTVTHHHDDFVEPSADDIAAAREAGLPWFSGGTVEHGGGPGPITEALNCPPGAVHKELMRSSMLRDRLWVFTMQGEDMPKITNRVDLHPSVRDVHAQPAGRVTYSPHRFEQAASAHFAPKLEAIHTEAGASWAATTTSPPMNSDMATTMGWAPISRHVMGTCRMGTDPRTSVVDPYGRFHDVENMICVDSSVFVTSSGYNPTLTIVALAIRAARALAGGRSSSPGADPAAAHR
jgi:gluconate 2-dehydrogenase alpha chain